MENLTGGTPPVRPLPCVVPCKLYFGFVKTNPALTDAKTGKKFLEDLIDEIDREINGFMVTHQYVDTVSQFYIEFLRYANNDKGLGIVLTPPHITDLFAELAGVDKKQRSIGQLLRYRWSFD